METGAPAPATTPAPSPSARRAWPFWAIFVGGISLAAGLLLPLGLFLLEVYGVFSAAPGVEEVAAWDLSANLLEGFGFLAGFLGIAIALRVDAPKRRGTARREFLAVFVGGVLVTSGIVVASVLAGYLVVLNPTAPLFFVDLGEIVGRLLQASGFILVFAGIASALRPCP